MRTRCCSTAPPLAENIDIAANGGRVLFFRNIANVTMDLNDVEGIDFNALGGADTIVVNDLSGTDVTETNLALAASGGGGDAQPDNVIVQAPTATTSRSSRAAATRSACSVSRREVNITQPEAANDRLTVNALAGDDVVEASGLAAGLIQLVGNGGDDDDVLVGSDGADVLIGDVGDDVLARRARRRRPRRRPRRQHRHPGLTHASAHDRPGHETGAVVLSGTNPAKEKTPCPARF